MWAPLSGQASSPPHPPHLLRCPHGHPRVLPSARGSTLTSLPLSQLRFSGDPQWCFRSAVDCVRLPRPLRQQITAARDAARSLMMVPWFRATSGVEDKGGLAPPSCCFCLLCHQHRQEAQSPPHPRVLGRPPLLHGVPLFPGPTSERPGLAPTCVVDGTELRQPAFPLLLWTELCPPNPW